MPVKDPHSFADLSQGLIKHIDFEIRVDFETRILTVGAAYQLAEPVSGTFYLDTLDLEIERVYSGDEELDWSLTEQNESLGQRLELQNLEKIHGFTIDLRTSPAAEALQWMTPHQTLGGKHSFLYSQCQSISARSIFPCQDTPSVRFTYAASVTVPKPLMAVMAAEAVGSQQDENASTFQFKMPQPIPSYLFALAVGNLVFQEMGPRTGVYAEPEQLEAAAYEFAENEAKLVEAEKLFGPYKWDRYDLLILPPSFPYGGMENPRLTFLTPMSIRGNRLHTDIVSHELAHAWTGNLVTNATWEHAWLNEGWTTYAEKRISEVLYGVDHIQITNYIQRNQMFEVMERVITDPKYTCLRTHLEGVSPDEGFTLVTYAKGYTFLLMVEQAVGREAFDEFIHKYINAFSFQSLTTEEFIDFMRAELPSVFDLVNVQEWLYEPGFPESAPEIHSRQVAEVDVVNEKYRQGILPTTEVVKDWDWMQTSIFLRALPVTISIEDCRYFEDLFALDEDTYPPLLGDFYKVCIRSGYEQIYPQVEALFSATGRLAVIMPVFRTMLDTEWTQALARPLFEEMRERYHPHTIAVFERFLKAAGM
ncbi:MAG: M1 family peptidase [Anaerolineales bacterium]|nr:M1 family peptidase [Anaerolineales bacterium]